jgi:protein-ribulosamine 3-kinase
LNQELHHWKPAAEKLLSIAFHLPVKIDSVLPAGGGCINECFVLQTAPGKFFLKRNNPEHFPKMFECEVKGLQILNDAVNGISPEVIVTDEQKDEMLIILPYIETGSPQKDFWIDFAKKLASLHRKTTGFFGLDHDNYIGSLSQSNRQHPDWNSFFILERIEPQLKKAIDEKQLPKEITRLFERMFLRLPEIFPAGPSSLIHGDLWSGNYMIGKDGRLRLIDPAVYYGFREMDLAMMKLFGGFDASVFKHYHEFFPLENGFEKRVDICNLYPLLVHVNLFGGHYPLEVQAIMKPFQSR